MTRRSASWARPVFRWLAIGTGVALLFCVVESLAIYYGHHSWRFRDPLPVVIRGMLPPWLLVAALAVGVRWLVRRFPIDRRPRIAIPVHLAAALSFPIIHLSILTTFHALAGWLGPGQTFGSQLPELIAYYYGASLTMYLGLAALFHAFDAAAELRRRAAAEAALRQDLTEARLQALRQQLGPHFLFNVMNTIAMLVRGGRQQEATVMLADLSELLRYLLHPDRAHEVPLHQELDMVRRYLALEQVRFHDRLETSLEAPGETLDALVPSLILQPLVENAIRYGIGDVSAPGRVSVEARREQSELVLEVKDSGNPNPSRLKPGTGIGLGNTRARLEALYGNRSRLDLVRGTEGGTRAIIRLPFMTDGSLVTSDA